MAGVAGVLITNNQSYVCRDFYLINWKTMSDFGVIWNLIISRNRPVSFIFFFLPIYIIL